MRNAITLTDNRFGIRTVPPGMRIVPIPPEDDEGPHVSGWNPVTITIRGQSFRACWDQEGDVHITRSFAASRASEQPPDLLEAGLILVMFDEYRLAMREEGWRAIEAHLKALSAVPGGVSNKA